jgi:hypothetical protein
MCRTLTSLHPEAALLRQDRQEAEHVAVDRDLLEDLAAQRPEVAVEVVQLDPTQQGAGSG